MADKNIPIIPLKESDIISQSVNTINQNFKTIVNNYDIANFKWEQYSKKITDEIEKLKRHCDKSNMDISRSVDSLNTRIDNIQTQINNAIMNANLELTGFISDLAGQQVANAMGGYVKTSSLDNKLKGYVASSAFETYKSDAKNRTASSNLIVANSKFATIKDKGVDYLIKSDGAISQYKTIEEYWEKEAKSTYPDLSDADTLKNFIGNCETKFKTVSTELANISAKVGQGSAQVDIIAAVEGEGGKNIFVTGHPEYDTLTLDQEYKRDLAKGINPEIPINYYPDDDPEQKPIKSWRCHANTLYTNWLNYYVYQATPYDWK